MKEEFPYWMALAHLPKLKIARKNELIVRLFEEKLSIIDFFHLERLQLVNLFSLSEPEMELIKEARNELPNYSFLAEDLLNQGYSIIPITSEKYSPWMKKNLKRTYSPPLIYTKGNNQIMKENSIAIVGSRKANKISLEFTDHVAKEASRLYKVVVSGFAKGVDKQALDSAIRYKGQSIIVLPQGITTFQSGFKKYYKQIVDGDVLALCTYFPNAPWSTAFAMGRNPIIYGLAREIFVAESSDSGGTWAGALDGLKKGREIYVRIPASKEKNANDLLISKGAIAVDQSGQRVTEYKPAVEDTKEPKLIDEQIELKILHLLSHGNHSAKEIIDNLKLDIPSQKLSGFLKKHEKVITLKSQSPIKFTLPSENQKQKTLFDESAS